MDREYARPLDVPTLARSALMSPAHFSRRFRAAYGETPYSYLMTRRIERAMALLRAGMSVTDACMAVGCTSLGSFSSRFAEIVGETPTAYRSREHARSTRCPLVWQRLTRPVRTHRADGEPVRIWRQRSAHDRSLAWLVMTISLQHCNITVNDVDESIAFYGEALGLKVLNDVASGGFRWVTLGSAAQPDSTSCSPCLMPAARRPTATRCRSC